MRPADTTQEAHEMQVAVWRRMTGSERVEVAIQMTEDVRRIAADGIRHRHPEYTSDDVRWALFRLLLRDELFAKAHPRAPRLPA